MIATSSFRFLVRNSVRRAALLGLALGLANLPAVSHATDQPPPPDRKAPMADHLQRMAEDLGLTQQQKAQVADILKAERDKLTALRDDPSMDRRERFKALRKIREEGREQIRALLTPEQRKKFDAMPKPKPGRRAGPGGNGSRED